MALDDILQRRVGPFPIWTWVGLAGAAGFLFYRFRTASKAGGGTSGNPGQGTQFSSTQTQSGTDTSGGQYSSSYTATGNGYLPGYLTTAASPMPYSGGDIYINYPATTSTQSSSPVPGGPAYTDVLDRPGGRDLGNYEYGSDEVNYIANNIGVGSYGFNQPLEGDIQAAYNKMVSLVGQDQANQYHYSWLGPGNVQAIPRFTTMAQQIVGGLPNNPSPSSPGPIPVANPDTVAGGQGTTTNQGGPAPVSYNLGGAVSAR